MKHGAVPIWHNVGTEGEVEAAVIAGKWPEMDDITSELVSSGVEGTVKALTALCQNIWEQKKWPTESTKSLPVVIPLPKKEQWKH